MQVSLTLKECKRCGSVYYDGAKEITLTSGQLVEVNSHKVRECPHCPEEIGPRGPGYRKL